MESDASVVIAFVREFADWIVAIGGAITVLAGAFLLTRKAVSKLLPTTVAPSFRLAYASSNSNSSQLAPRLCAHRLTASTSTPLPKWATPTTTQVFLALALITALTVALTDRVDYFPHADRVSDGSATTRTSSAPKSPTAPRGLSAVARSSSSIAFSWGDNSNNEAAFDVYRWDGSTWMKIAILGANVTSYTDIGLQELTTYYYTVCTQNSAGAACAGTSSSATTHGLLRRRRAAEGDALVHR